MTAEEMASILNISPRQLLKDFPSTTVRFAKQGILLKREKENNIWFFESEQIEPVELTKQDFAIHTYTRGKEITNLPNEIWVTTYCSNKYEISNFGRLKNIKTQKEIKGCLNRDGYKQVTIDGKNYRLHRVVL